MQIHESLTDLNSRHAKPSPSCALFYSSDRFDASLDESALQADLAALGDHETATILCHRYRPTYLNLFSLFRNDLEHNALRRIAAHITREATWSYAAAERYMLRFPEQPLEISHEGWNRHALNRLLSRGKGLIICSFRFGMYNFLPLDLALLGFPVTCPVADTAGRVTEKVFAELRRRLATDSTADEHERRKAQDLVSIRLLEVRNRSTSLGLVRALRRQSILFIYADGNNGITGGWGDDGRLPVTFFGSPVYVKTGVARLSLLCDAPILPVISIKTGPATGSVHLLDPIVPESGQRGTSDESLTHSIMQQLYGHLQSYASRSPEQWEGVSAVHRWRHCMDTSVTDDTSEPNCDIPTALQRGLTFRINTSGGITALPGDEPVWVDTDKMRMVRIPQGAEHLASALTSVSGVDLNWVQSQEAGLRTAILSYLGDLHCRKLIASS